MEAWRGKGDSVALAAMGAVATLVGLAMVESAANVAAALDGQTMSGAEFLRWGGQALVLGGAALFFGAIYAYVQASRRTARDGARHG